MTYQRSVVCKTSDCDQTLLHSCKGASVCSPLTSVSAAIEGSCGNLSSGVLASVVVTSSSFSIASACSTCVVYLKFGQVMQLGLRNVEVETLEETHTCGDYVPSRSSHTGTWSSTAVIQKQRCIRGWGYVPACQIESTVCEDPEAVRTNAVL